MGEAVRGERYGYRAANLGVDGIHHAGHGGAGGVFARHVAALVLRGKPMSCEEWLGPRSEAFWAQSIAFKLEWGWQPPDASSYPDRVYAVLSQSLKRPAPELRTLMELLIATWKRPASDVGSFPLR